MKIPFRITLLTLLLFLVGGTVLVIGLISYAHARFTADELASQLLDQTATRIEQQIDKLLRQATDLSALTEKQVRSGRFRADDFPALIAYWHDTMEVSGDLTSLFIGLEGTGESTGLSRLSGKLSVWQSTLRPQKGTYEVREYWPADYPRRPFAFDPEKTTPDTRTRPWYIDARRARRPVWTETYVFLGLEGVRDIHGVTLATPVHDEAGRLQGVLAADFELQQLCRFFQTLKLGQDGIAFVIENRRDGSQQVIAHPQDELLFRTNTVTGQPRRELYPPERFPDPRVSAFAGQLPPAAASGPSGASSVRVVAGGEAHLGMYRRLEGESFPPWTICVILPEDEVLGRVHRSTQITLFIGVGVLLLAVCLSLYVSAQVARPLEALSREAEAIGHLQIEPRPVAHSIVREVDRLSVAMENMKGGLRSFQKYVPADLVRTILSAGQEASLGGDVRAVTIFFSDIANFTTISEELRPEDLVERLREYLSALSHEIQATAGTVDKYIGDAIMAFWGAPGRNPQHAVAACQAALRCQAVLCRLHEQWQAAGKASFHTRIGLHTGEVVVGNIGSETRLNYTVIGDAVNLASRLEGLNKYYGTNILISETTYQEAGAVVLARPLDYVSVKGKQRPVLIYELLSLQADASKADTALADACGWALACYRRQEWDKAIRLFEEVLVLRPNDPPALLMLARCRAFQTTPPGPEWDGVYCAVSK